MVIVIVHKEYSGGTSGMPSCHIINAIADLFGNTNKLVSHEWHDRGMDNSSYHYHILCPILQAPLLSNMQETGRFWFRQQIGSVARNNRLEDMIR